MCGRCGKRWARSRRRRCNGDARARVLASAGGSAESERHMTGLEILGLSAAAAIAGAINAIAGGGTLITFPVLLFYGTPALVANATSTLALVIGTAGSIFGFREYFRA